MWKVLLAAISLYLLWLAGDAIKLGRVKVEQDRRVATALERLADHADRIH